MRALHGHTLREYSISVAAHSPEGVFASQVHACLDSCSARGRKLFAGIQQFVETFTRALSAPGRAELDVTSLLATLGSRSVETHREAIQNMAGVCQHDVARTLRENGLDFFCEIEAAVNLVGKGPACLDGLLAPALD